MKLLEGTRIVKTRNSQKNSSFELINNRLGIDLSINYSGAKIIRCIFDQKEIKNKHSSFVRDLKELGLVIDSDEEQKNVFLCDNKKIEYPLSCLNVELTNRCNLKCIHCYGDFGHCESRDEIGLEWFRSHLEEFDRLNIRSISLTGGESTLNKDFLQIANLLLERGFELAIFTNGLNFEKIKMLLENTNKYHYTIKISLDGFEKTHDKIRGVEGCFKRAYQTIKEVSKYPNVKLYISSILMKSNFDEINEFKEWVKKEFPNANHSVDLIFPTDYCKEQCFNEKEFDKVYDKMPSIFKYITEKSGRSARCSGGISQCTLQPDGRLKICNSAGYEGLYFSNNVFVSGLSFSWNNCGDNIKLIRKEKNHKTKDCVKCKMKKKCNNTDCRITSFNYNKDMHRSNPITCFITKKGCESL